MNQLSDRAREESPGTIKLVGIGQSLRGDDAAGLEAVRLWREKYQPPAQRQDVQVELAELPGIGLLSLLEGTALAILVDAVHSGASAGTIHILTPGQLESFSHGATSAHGWGVAETLSMGQKLMPDAMPGKLIMIGIEASGFGVGVPLSPEVTAALPQVAYLIEQFIAGGLPTRLDQSSSPRISPR